MGFPRGIFAHVLRSSEALHWEKTPCRSFTSESVWNQIPGDFSSTNNKPQYLPKLHFWNSASMTMIACIGYPPTEMWIKSPLDTRRLAAYNSQNVGILHTLCYLGATKPSSYGLASASIAACCVVEGKSSGIWFHADLLVKLLHGVFARCKASDLQTRAKIRLLRPIMET